MWDHMGSGVPRVRKEALTIRHERTDYAVSSALPGPRLRATSAIAVFATCMREMSRAEASYATNATGHYQNAVGRITPNRTRKKIKARKNPLKPSECSVANAWHCANQKGMGRQLPRSCPNVGGNAASVRDMMVLTDATNAGLRG